MNDADASISAEIWGHESEYKDVENEAIIIIGTGIGVSLFLNRSLYTGSHGLIEAGHSIVSTSHDARLCGCGQRGCVEVYASAKNTAIRMIEVDREQLSNQQQKSDEIEQSIIEKCI